MPEGTLIKQVWKVEMQERAIADKRWWQRGGDYDTLDGAMWNFTNCIPAKDRKKFEFRIVREDTYSTVVLLP